MTERAVAISLKIPDNTAYTALVALRRLGIDVERVERSEIWIFEDSSDGDALTRRIKGDETIFNPNKHRLELLERCAPRAGEVWIEPLNCGAESKGAKETAPRAIAWRLLDSNGLPADQGLLDAAVERLLCNPAIEKARR
jgi:hypothetical protein